MMAAAVAPKVSHAWLDPIPQSLQASSGCRKMTVVCTIRMGISSFPRHSQLHAIFTAGKCTRMIRRLLPRRTSILRKSEWLVTLNPKPCNPATLTAANGTRAGRRHQSHGVGTAAGASARGAGSLRRPCLRHCGGSCSRRRRERAVWAGQLRRRHRLRRVRGPRQRLLPGERLTCYRVEPAMTGGLQG